MKKSDKLKRAIAFYFSVALFLILMPILLSYSLGYKIDYHKLKAYKTGIIYVNSRPSGAMVYINGKKRADLTPAQIEELKPGSYNIQVAREGFYPWEGELIVNPGMVTKADHIVLFPMKQEMNMLVEYDIIDMAVSDKNYIYYMTHSGLFRSAMDGGGTKCVLLYSNWPRKIIDKKFSPDNNKLMFFTPETIYIAYLDMSDDFTAPAEENKVEKIFESQSPIINVFWYSGSNYLTVVSEKDIKVVELRGDEKKNVVTLYTFNSKPQSIYYDDANDSIYFTDTIKTSSGSFISLERRHLYRLDLRQKFFDKFMKLLMKKEPEAKVGKK